MKKIVILIAVLCFGTLVAAAQEQTFTKGTNVASLGIGFFGNLYSGSDVKKVPPLTLSYERGVKDNLFDEKSSLGIGGVIGYASAKYEYAGGFLGSYGWKSSNFIIGVHGTLHYAFFDKLDTYTRLMLGYNVVSFKWLNGGSISGTAAAASGITWNWSVGARYDFYEQLGAFVEIGAGLSIFNLGVTYKF